MATRKILFRGQTRHKGEKTSISGKPLPGIWVTGGIFPQNKGYERAIIYTQDPKVENKQWLKKDGIRNLLKDRLAEIKSLNSTIKELEKKIDTFEDWKSSIKYGTHYSDTSYRSLSAACERNGKNLFAVQSDAEVFIAARFGFNASKLVIIPDVETYESNRYGNVRLAKAEIRKPLYVSESFNYARFDVLCKGGHMQWELVDGKLCDYESPNI